MLKILWQILTTRKITEFVCNNKSFPKVYQWWKWKISILELKPWRAIIWLGILVLPHSEDLSKFTVSILSSSLLLLLWSFYKSFPLHGSLFLSFHQFGRCPALSLCSPQRQKQILFQMRNWNCNFAVPSNKKVPKTFSRSVPFRSHSLIFIQLLAASKSHAHLVEHLRSITLFADANFGESAQLKNQKTRKHFRSY